MTNSFPEDKIKEIEQLFTEPRKVTIICHYNPDGDALGSSLALKFFLEKNGHSVHTIFPSGYPSYYKWMPKINECVVYSGSNKEKIAGMFEESEIVFCLDFNATSRVNDLKEILANNKSKKILIDHHQEPADEFDIYFSYPSRSSTCELIFEFIEKWKGIDAIDINIGTCIYTGLITDTGGFQFSSTHTSTHNVAAKLIQIGVNTSDIFNRSFNNFSLNRLKLFGYCIDKNMKIYEEQKLATIFIDNATKQKFNIQDGDTEGLVNYPLKVLEINASVLFKEDNGQVRMSFRSKNDVDVSKIARKYFNGGGHINAAGGISKKPLDETIAYFESIIEKSF